MYVCLCLHVALSFSFCFSIFCSLLNVCKQLGSQTSYMYNISYLVTLITFMLTVLEVLSSFFFFFIYLRYISLLPIFDCTTKNNIPLNCRIKNIKKKKKDQAKLFKQLLKQH